MNIYDFPSLAIQIPQHIRTLIQELEFQIRAVNTPGLSDDLSERYGLEESRVHEHLRQFGWDAALDAEGRHWLPAPPHFTIVQHLPDHAYYIQRCSASDSQNAQWAFITEEQSLAKWAFTTWEEAYSFLFSLVAREQEQKSLALYRVRNPRAWGGHDYLASSQEQAVALARNDAVLIFHLSSQEAAHLDLQAYEHTGGLLRFCAACHFYPCCCGVKERWKLPSQIGILAFPQHLPALPEQMAFVTDTSAQIAPLRDHNAAAS